MFGLRLHIRVHGKLRLDVRGASPYSLGPDLPRGFQAVQTAHAACLGMAFSVKVVAILTDHIQCNVLMIGLSGTVWVPLANGYGRRPVLLVSALCLFVSSICGISPGSFGSFLAIRIFQGIGSSAAETVAVVTVGDMHFISQRSRRMVCQLTCGLETCQASDFPPT